MFGITPTSTGIGELVLCRHRPILALFKPMSTRGSFMNPCWATWDINDTGRLMYRQYCIEGPLSDRDECGLAMLITNHHFWWTEVEGGAFMITRRFYGDKRDQARNLPKQKLAQDSVNALN